MKPSDSVLLLAALAGLVGVAVAMSRWAPDAEVKLPERDNVLERAGRDAADLGYQLREQARIQVSAGPRLFVPVKAYHSLVMDEPDRRSRRARIRAAPPVRLAARFRTAVAPNGTLGDLVLEYDGSGRLVGASFGLDDLIDEGLAPAGAEFFADRLAEKLLGEPPPAREESGLGGARELIYRPAPDRPNVYVYIGNSGGWTAQLQPAPDLLVSRQTRGIFSLRPEEQIRLYAFGVVGMLALGVLLWRLARRRAGLTETGLPALLLGVGLLPVVGVFQVLPSVLVALVLLYLLPQFGVLLAWVVGEAEMREARPGSVEHWDRLVRRRPTRATGRCLLIGLGFGAVLAGLLAASGEAASPLGGGYGTHMLLLPDYWTLPTPLNRGMALAAATAFLVGLGGRLAGPPGAVIGAAIAGLGWSLVAPVVPESWALLFGVLAALAAGWAVWRHGLLALSVACVTGLSLPAAWAAWQASPYMLGPALVASLPVLVLPLGLWLVRRAPEQDTLAALEPAYVANLENEARLRGEVELLRELQLSLLPRPEAGSRYGVEVAWRMIPAEAVGGDFLDLIEDEEGRLWIAVADAAGHGIACSVLTAFTKAAVTEHAVAGRGAGDALRGIRRLFGRLGTPRSLVTLLLAVLEPSTGRLRVATAGHPPMLLCDEEGAREVGAPGRPLGVELPGDDGEVSVLCPQGALLVAYTDGVLEAASPTDESFGYDRWRRMLPGLRQEPAGQILDALLGAVAEHRGGRPADDDVTALVLRRGELREW